MKYEVCKTSGANMKRCKKCGQIFCQKCALKGIPPYPLVKAVNKCPYCGKYNCMETVR